MITTDRMLAQLEQMQNIDARRSIQCRPPLSPLPAPPAPAPSPNHVPEPPPPTPTKTPTRWLDWWPLLLGPLGMVVAYAIDRSGPPPWYTKPRMEEIAIGVSAAALAAAVLHALVARRLIFVLLLGVALTVLLREIHWEWTTTAVYISLASIGVLAFFLRHELIPYLRTHARARVCTT